MNEHTTLAAIAALPASMDPNQKTWVNGAFLAEVANLQTRQTKTGRPFWTATLVDRDDGTSLATVFFVDPTKYAGKLCRFSGAGISREEFNGRAKIGLSQKTTITVMDASQRQGMGQQQTFAPQTRTVPAATQGASHGPRSGVLGVTVGMAMNNAIAALSRTGTAPEPGTKAWAESVHVIASDIIRIAHALEGGNLAPTATQREAQAQGLVDVNDFESIAPEPIAEPEPRQRHQPGPGGSVQLPSGAADDLPF